jgi:hypothetical protein
LIRVGEACTGEGSEPLVQCLRLPVEWPSETILWVVRRRGRSASCRILGSRRCPRRLFSCVSCREEAVGLESP